MRTPTEQEITDALQANAAEANGRWHFGGALKGHTVEQARDIVESCLSLDVVVTDILTGAQWTLLVRTVAALEARVRELESESEDRRTWRQEQSERNDG